MDQEYIKKIILTYPEANGLPENIIQNIAKIAVLQNKVDKPAWILKMVYDAKKKFEQSLAAKKLKIESKVQENKSSIKRENLKEDKVLFFKKDELEHHLPYIKNLRGYYPKLSNVTWFYILENYAQWPLIVMSIFPERDRLFPQWAVQCAATLSDIGLKKILELNLHKNADELYRYLKENGNFKDHHIHRSKYISFVKKFDFSRKKKENNSSNSETLGVKEIIKSL